MAEPVKPRRGYHSPHRQQQAEATREAILDAAERLFARQGYAATTMAAIAAEAGVAARTVYVAFVSKGGVLRGLWHLRLRGDQADVPVGERGWSRDVLAEPAPERTLRLTAERSRAVKERAGPLFATLRSAAHVDPDAAALWQRIQQEFLANQRGIVESLAGALAPGLDVDRGADPLWALNQPDLWHLLVIERSWTPAAWERWFGDAAIAQLLGR